MAFELPPLPYDYSALEPTIDAATMKLHHDMHHAAYVKNLNAALEKHPELQSKSAEDLIRDLNAMPEDIRGAVRNNGGGHVNHSMFWKIMKPKGGGDPSGAVARRDQESFRQLQGFSDQVQRCRRQAVRQRLGLAGRKKGWRRADSQHRQPGQPHLPGTVPHLRQRRVGARLLPQVQQSPSRISGGLVECCELGRNQQALRESEIRSTRAGTGPLIECCNATKPCHVNPWQGFFA